MKDLELLESELRTVLKALSITRRERDEARRDNELLEQERDAAKAKLKTVEQERDSACDREDCCHQQYKSAIAEWARLERAALGRPALNGNVV